jgi:hypothetical protein
VRHGSTNLFHPLLFDPVYWQGRLGQLSGRSAKMLILPRPDLEVPGQEVVELLLRSHDGVRLKGLVSWWPISGDPKLVTLHWPTDGMDPRLHLLRSAPNNLGAADLYLYPDPDRRLEDRVLDFICMISGARKMPKARRDNLRLELASGEIEPDEYRIGKALLDRGWCPQ